ncbi:MAG TPA: VWA domain-containing protein [Candidatus Sulfotelmatobacter sp.]|nr:VWA domain-containing protein [Candidatus Sulfotelmatobacter sp.]
MLKIPAVRSRNLAAIAACLCLTVTLCIAQQAPAPSQKPDNGSQAKPAGQAASDQISDDQKPQETLKVNVNVVQLFFNVKDKKGTLIPNLTKTDFEIAEDGKAQTIKYFTAESNLPLTLGILIDSSGSQARVLDMEKEVGGAFLKQILRNNDEAFVIGFDVDVDLLQDFTNDVHRLQAALNKAKINIGGGNLGPPGIGGGPIPTSNPRGTLLYDSVYLAGHDMLAKETGRKAMILLTDGEDQGSQLTVKDAVEAAQKSDSIVYVLLCADRGFYGSAGMGYYGEGEMKKLTEQTGGRLINVGNNFQKLRDAFEQIANELRSQYNIGYTPDNTKLDGSYRKLEIKNKQGYKIQARAGYYAGRSQD